MELVEVILPDRFIAVIVMLEVATAVVAVQEMIPVLLFKLNPSGKFPVVTEYERLLPEN